MHEKLVLNSRKRHTQVNKVMKSKRKKKCNSLDNLTITNKNSRKRRAQDNEKNEIKAKNKKEKETLPISELTVANKSQFTLPVINFDFLIGKSVSALSRHGKNWKNFSIRAVFCGPSGCGKTNALFTILIHINGLRWINVYIFSKSLNQDKYQWFIDFVKSIKEVQVFVYSENEQVISPEEVLPNSIKIFDDIACEKQDNVRNFYSMGRHMDVDSFYLCQSYARIPKHLIRDNFNFLVLFDRMK